MSIKKCGCCKRDYTEREWSLLPLKGFVDGLCDDAGRHYVLELRDCACFSTLAVEMYR